MFQTPGFRVAHDVVCHDDDFVVDWLISDQLKEGPELLFPNFVLSRGNSEQTSQTEITRKLNIHEPES